MERLREQRRLSWFSPHSVWAGVALQASEVSASSGGFDADPASRRDRHELLRSFQRILQSAYMTREFVERGKSGGFGHVQQIQRWEISPRLVRGSNKPLLIVKDFPTHLQSAQNGE